MPKNLTEAETETPCPFIAFFCNGCEEEPCSCAEHGDMIDVCLPLSPDLPEEPTAGDLQSKKAQCCEWGDWGDGHEACEVYIRADRDKWRAHAEAAEKRIADAGENLKSYCAKCGRFKLQSSPTTDEPPCANCHVYFAAQDMGIGEELVPEEWR